MTPKEHEVSKSVFFDWQVTQEHIYGQAHGMESFWVTVPCQLCNWVGKDKRSGSPDFSPCRVILHAKLPAQRAASSPPRACNTKESMCLSNVWVPSTTNTLPVVALYGVSHLVSELLSSTALLREPWPRSSPKHIFLLLCWLESVVE